MTSITKLTETSSDAQDSVSRLTELPPSAKLVFYVLWKEAPVTQEELAERTLLPRRTTRGAVKTLKEADLVEESIHVGDARKKEYRPRDGLGNDESET